MKPDMINILISSDITDSYYRPISLKDNNMVNILQITIANFVLI